MTDASTPACPRRPRVDRASARRRRERRADARLGGALALRARRTSPASSGSRSSRATATARLPLELVRQLPARHGPPHRVPRRLPGADRRPACSRGCRSSSGSSASTGSPSGTAGTGHAVIYLALAHVVCTVWGYAKQDGVNWFQEYWNWLTLPQPTGARARSARRRSAALPPPSLQHQPRPADDLAVPGDHHRDDRHVPARARARHLARRSCGASSRTSGGTRSTSPPTPGSRSPGST